MIKVIGDCWPFSKIEENEIKAASSFVEGNSLYYVVGATALAVLLSYVYLKGSWKKREVEVIQSPLVKISEPLPFTVSLKSVLETTQGLADDDTSFFLSINIAKAYSKINKPEKATFLLQTAIGVIRFSSFKGDPIQGLIDVADAVFCLKGVDVPLMLERILQVSDCIVDDVSKILILNSVIKNCRDLKPNQAYSLLEKVLGKLSGNEKGLESVVKNIAETCHHLNPKQIPGFFNEFLVYCEGEENLRLRISAAQAYLLFEPEKGIAQLTALLSSSPSILSVIEIAEAFTQSDPAKTYSTLEKMLVETETSQEKMTILTEIARACRSLKPAEAISILENVFRYLEKIEDNKKRSELFLAIMASCASLELKQIPRFLEPSKMMTVEFVDDSAKVNFFINLAKIYRSKPEKVVTYLSVVFKALEQMPRNEQKAEILVSLLKASNNWENSYVLELLEKILTIVIENHDKVYYLKIMDHFPHSFWENTEAVSIFYQKIKSAREDNQGIVQLAFLIHWQRHNSEG